MNDLEQQFGYLQGKVEQVSEDIQKMSETQTIILNKLDEVERDISIVKIVFKTVKWIGLSIIAISTFKFGDIHSLWDYIRS